MARAGKRLPAPALRGRLGSQGQEQGASILSHKGLRMAPCDVAYDANRFGPYLVVVQGAARRGRAAPLPVAMRHCLRRSGRGWVVFLPFSHVGKHRNLVAPRLEPPSVEQRPARDRRHRMDVLCSLLDCRLHSRPWRLWQPQMVGGMQGRRVRVCAQDR